MNKLQIIFIIITITLLSFGQVLFKLASEKINFSYKSILTDLIINPNFLIALFVYGIATLLWLFVLKITPLKIAYPFAALAFIIVPVLSFFFFGEMLNWNTFVGALIILLGVYISIM